MRENVEPMTEVTPSSKNQIVIPREARRALGLKAGDELLVVIRADRIIVLQKPKSHYQAIRRLSKRRYPENYLKNEHQSWR